jgi:hypothetical protein
MSQMALRMRQNSSTHISRRLPQIGIRLPSGDARAFEDSEAVLFLCFTQIRRGCQSEQHDFFARRRADVMVQTHHSYCFLGFE